MADYIQSQMTLPSGDVVKFKDNVSGYTTNTGTVTSVKIQATSPIAIDSDAAITTSGTRTLSHANSGATAGSYGDSTAQTPAYGGTFKVPYVTVDAKGHVTAISDHTVKIPASDNTDTHRPIQVNGTQNLGNNTTPLNLKNGSNVSITASGGDVTIAATDTTYESKAASSGGTAVSLVTTGEKYTWNNKQAALVSGTNIKTVNSTSLLGSGNIDIGQAFYPGDAASTSSVPLNADQLQGHPASYFQESLGLDGETTNLFLNKKGEFVEPVISVTIDQNTVFNINGTTFKLTTV